MQRKLFWFSVLVGLSGLLRATPAQAISLDFVPAAQTVGVGEPLNVDVVLSGLGLGGPPSVGAFDLGVSFDPTLLSPLNVVFGPFLGDPGLLEAFTDFTFGSGVVDFAETSLLFPATLDALQPASFTLAMLSFTTLGIGSSPLTFSDALVLDAFAEPLSLTIGSGSAAATAAVPEPGTLVLLASGFTGLAIARRQQARRLLRRC